MRGGGSSPPPPRPEEVLVPCARPVGWAALAGYPVAPQAQLGSTDCACFRTGPRVAHPREVSVRASPLHECVHTDCACFRSGPRVAHPRQVSVRAPPSHGCGHTDCACRRACVRRRCACRRACAAVVRAAAPRASCARACDTSLASVAPPRLRRFRRAHRSVVQPCAFPGSLSCAATFLSAVPWSPRFLSAFS